MAARRRPGRRFALALAVSLAVHAGLFVVVMNGHPPMAGGPERRGCPVEPVLYVDLEPRAAPPQPHAAAPAAAGRRAARPAANRRQDRATAPRPRAPTSPRLRSARAIDPTRPGTTGGAVRRPGHRRGRWPGEGLTFDCPPGGELTRTGAVRANPCAFRGATRNHLPEAVVKQARIDRDKAEFYDRVLKARDDIRNDPNKGNLPFLHCPA